MSTTTTTAAKAPQTVWTPSPLRKRWTIAEFDRLHRDGYLREGSRTYLWDGEIIEPMTVNRPHVQAVGSLRELLFLRLPRTAWTVDQDAPVILREGFKPQPDLMVLVGPRHIHGTKTPVPADVALLIEVSDSTLSKDLGDHLRAYAGAGVRQYWVVDLNARRVDVYANPTRDETGTPCYADRRSFAPDGSVPLNLIQNEATESYPPIPVSEIFLDGPEPEAAR
ncbi:MAG: Uma2 family endonuclease [Isosphaeraceae bacterium]